eukprot:3732163-Amphidinium_carterae.1
MEAKGQGYFFQTDTLGFEPTISRYRSGCDTTTPCARSKPANSPFEIEKFHRLQLPLYKSNALIDGRLVKWIR